MSTRRASGAVPVICYCDGSWFDQQDYWVAVCYIEEPKQLNYLWRWSSKIEKDDLFHAMTSKEKAAELIAILAALNVAAEYDHIEYVIVYDDEQIMELIKKRRL